MKIIIPIIALLISISSLCISFTKTNNDSMSTHRPLPVPIGNYNGEGNSKTFKIDDSPNECLGDCTLEPLADYPSSNSRSLTVQEDTVIRNAFCNMKYDVLLTNKGMVNIDESNKTIEIGNYDD